MYKKLVSLSSWSFHNFVPVLKSIRGVVEENLSIICLEPVEMFKNPCKRLLTITMIDYLGSKRKH